MTDPNSIESESLENVLYIMHRVPLKAPTNLMVCLKIFHNFSFTLTQQESSKALFYQLGRLVNVYDRMLNIFMITPVNNREIDSFSSW